MVFDNNLLKVQLARPLNIFFFFYHELSARGRTAFALVSRRVAIVYLRFS